MTKHSSKGRYETLVHGLEQIESSLHTNLIEHLNAEIVLQTITNSKLIEETWCLINSFGSTRMVEVNVLVCTHQQKPWVLR